MQVSTDHGFLVEPTSPEPPWPFVPLPNVIAHIVDNRGRTAPVASSGIPLIATDCIKEDALYPVRQNLRYVSQETYETWFRGHPEPGDVILVNKGTPGRVCQVPAPVDFCIAQDMVALRPKPGVVDPDYLLAALRSRDFKEQVEGLHVGTMIPHLKKTNFHYLKIPLPPVPIQQAIGRIYCDLSRKLELNRRINRTLEELAGALFQAWFVDFEPVVAKAAGRAPFGVAPEASYLFPTTFTDSELGRIPHGWRYGPIKQTYRAMFDGPHATPPDSDSGPVFLGIKNLTGTGIDLKGARYISEADYPRWTRRVTPNHLDIVFTYEATIGFCALIPPDLRCCLGRRLALVRAHAGTEHFLFHSMVAAPFQELLAARIWSGSTVDRIPLTEFPDYPMLWPGEALAKAFDAAVKPWWRMIHQNETESQTLAALRDTLLPKLLSGEVRVKQAERALENA